VFQIAWMRELRLIFGATTAAAAAVLGIFMAGLGIGSALLGKVADRVSNPLRMYGQLEVAIALSAATTPWLVSLASQIYLGLGGQESLGIAGATATRLTLASAVMAIPTVLMGGTLPAVVRSVTRTTDLHRRALGVIYGSNTLGAVLGTAIATFFALETLGTRATLMCGSAIGFLAGVIAIWLSRLYPAVATEPRASISATAAPAQPTAETATAIESGHAEHDGGRVVLYFTAAVLGFTFFALELVWYRMLGPILGGTAFTFGLILCVALLGIGVGGILYNSLFYRWRPTRAALAATCGLEAFFAIFAFALGDRLALFTAAHSEAAGSFSELVLTWAWVTSIVVLPVSLVAGVQFPLLIALLGSARRAVSRDVGVAYAWNTFGAIAGSLIAGFGALPLLTAPGMWQGIALLLAALSIVVIVGSIQTHRRTAIVVVMLAVATVALSFAEGPTAVWRHTGIGARRAYLPYHHPNQLREWINMKRHGLIWEAEGIESSIGIVGHNGLAFVVNGKVDGNSLEDAATQIGVSILGAVLHDDPKTALVIGLGTGESAGWLAEMRNMEHVDVVELEPAIDEMARRCSELNWDVLDNPRVRRINNDGREFVFSTQNQYDIIISEPSNPYRAGVASLYTSEFYAAARQRLKPGGLFIQWLQAYETDSMTVHTVVATARSAFDHVELWQTLPDDLQLVCSAGPIEHSAEKLRERLASDVVQSALHRAWKMTDLEAFLAHFLANADWAASVAILPEIERNTDDRTVLEYSFAKTVGGPVSFSPERLRQLVRKVGYHRPALGDNAIDWNLVEVRRQEFNLLFAGDFSQALVEDAADSAIVGTFSSFRRREFAGVVQNWPVERLTPQSSIQQLVLAASYAELGRPECLDLIAQTEDDYPVDAAGLRAIYFWRAEKVEQAIESMEHYFTLLADDPWVIPIFSESAFALCPDIAEASPDAARRFYDQLSRPFAFYRYEHARLLSRALAAKYLGPKEVIESLAVFEPHVPWVDSVLESRAKAYAAAKHPLAGRAERDWRWFREHEPTDQER
jgi:spermidine synthase